MGVRCLDPALKKDPAPAGLLADPRVAPLLERAPILRHVGRTPLLPLRRVGAPEGVRLLAKAEWFNPGGSVKDRPALFMVLEALVSGALGEGKVLLDSTSGNTGIAYAMLGRALGFEVEVCLPENASEERRRLLEAYGARVRPTDPLEGSEGARRVAAELFRSDPERYFLPDQYNNPANPRAHFETTGPEILAQTGGAVTHFVAGIGTGGTLMGAGRFLKAAKPGVQVWAAEPEDPFHGIEGLKHMASACVPGIYDPSWLDGILPVRTEAAYRESARLAREEGLLVGTSSGAALAAALELARLLAERGEAEGATIVTLFPDHGSRYLSAPAWREALGLAED